MANHSYLKDRLGFDPDELMNEVEDPFSFGPSDDNSESPSYKKFKSFKPSPSPSSSTSSMREYEHALSYVKGKEIKCDESVKDFGECAHHNCIIGRGRNDFFPFSSEKLIIFTSAVTQQFAPDMTKNRKFIPD
jgi:hypothetical protein